MVEKPTSERLAAYTAGLLSPQERRDVEAALAQQQSPHPSLELFDKVLNQHQEVPLPNPEATLKGALQRAERMEQESRLLRPPFKRNRSVWYGGAGLLAAAVLAFFLVLPQLRSRNIFRIKQITGQVSLSYKGQQQPATTGTEVAPGTLLTTTSNARATLTFPAGELRLTGSSRLTLVDAGLKHKKSHVNLQLAQGTLLGKIQKQRLAAFQVRTPHSSISVVGTEFALAVDKQETRILVRSGRLQALVPDRKKPVAVSRNKMLRVQKEQSRLTTVSLDTTNRRAWQVLEHAIRQRNNKQRKKADKKRAADFSERLILHDGSVLTGRILEAGSAAVRIRTRLGVLTIGRDKIRKIQYLHR